MQREQESGPAANDRLGPITDAYRSVAFRFTGRASEYFRIWVVNTALTLLTLGVFSAWAKVRTKQYFYRNTVVDGSAFDYVGNPTAILRARALTAAGLAAMLVISHGSVGLKLGVLALTALTVPWLLFRSVGFHANSTMYRNIRFGFDGRAAEVYRSFAAAACWYLLTCGLAYPHAAFILTRDVLTRCRWGELRFDWKNSGARYVGAHVLAGALALPMYSVLSALSLAAERLGWRDDLRMLPPLVLFCVYLIVLAAALRAGLKNLLYNGLELGDHVVTADFRTWEFVKLYLTNTLLVVLSCGLLIPWARVRVAAYEASCLTLHVRGELVAKVAPPNERTALGEGFSNLGDFDLGVGT